jgi:hypothetical protein
MGINIFVDYIPRWDFFAVTIQEDIKALEWWGFRWLGYGQIQNLESSGRQIWMFVVFLGLTKQNC